MYQILFKNFEHLRQGVNSTCRLGIGHYDRMWAIDEFEILSQQSGRKKLAMKLGLDAFKFSNMPDLAVATNCCTDSFEGILSSMYDAYGDEFNPDSIVTIISFSIIQ